MSCPVSTRWYEVLLHLNRSPEGRMRMQDLADLALQSRSGLTRVVDRMEAAGLVSREVCPSDRRGILAVITPEGRRSFRRAALLHVRGIERHFGRHLSESGPGGPPLTAAPAASGAGIRPRHRRLGHSPLVPSR